MPRQAPLTGQDFAELFAALATAYVFSSANERVKRHPDNRLRRYAETIRDIAGDSSLRPPISDTLREVARLIDEGNPDDWGDEAC